MTNEVKGDQAIRGGALTGRAPEMTYAGVLSFLRRKYSKDVSGAHVVVSGVPYDGSVSNRSGCRLGPQAIRAASVQLAELKAFPFDFDPFDHLAVVDFGDCYLTPQTQSSVPAAIVAHAESIIAQGAKMLTFGGDHFVTYPLLKAHAAKYGPVALVQFDAHSDTWEEQQGQLDHGTMFARGVDEGIIDTEYSIQIGIRTQNDDPHGFKIQTAPWIHRNGVDASIEGILNRVKDRPAYITFDIDCLDPAFAPGTGTPVAGGLASWQALEILRGLGSLDLIGMDVVEVAPAYDHSEITAIAAATVAHDWLCLLAQKIR
ncbi:agmatinase [Maritalea porphyrae]|uniref:Agmatinase n=1 Tax=Maritalea porphyrae TaxID=880732 RepID=A0ABQ5UTT5_9HYPH|nr:agmatinase [Maritalea porphyrae]GLQ18309.1 agmatinase [Maritalea porphyrae]